MLIKTTNKCSAGCGHCMESSTKLGTHMSDSTFVASLEFVERVERLAWSLGCPRLVLLSGGECTEHPKIVQYIAEVYNRDMWPLLITNGLWLKDSELKKAILRPEWQSLRIQITYDPRFYLEAPPRIDDPRITYIDSLSLLLPLGRLARKKDQTESGLPLKKAPSSFNFRSMVRHTGSFEHAIALLRSRAAVGLSGHCSPSISDNGDVVAGETRDCYKVGTVWSSSAELTRNTVKMKCNKCGLVDGLTLEQKQAIGEAP